MAERQQHQRLRVGAGCWEGAGASKISRLFFLSDPSKLLISRHFFLSDLPHSHHPKTSPPCSSAASSQGFSNSIQFASASRSISPQALALRSSAVVLLVTAFALKRNSGDRRKARGGGSSHFPAVRGGKSQMSRWEGAARRESQGWGRVALFP